MEIKVLLKIAALGGILFVVLQMTGQMFIQVGGQEPEIGVPVPSIVVFIGVPGPDVPVIFHTVVECFRHR